MLNLSFGTDSAQDYRLDPLAHAAEVAWSKRHRRRGLGRQRRRRHGPAWPTRRTTPPCSPSARGTPRAPLDRGDDVVPAFSQRGNAAAASGRPDLVAPGVSVVSLRGPGLVRRLEHGDRRGRVGDRFFKGSGTSQAAAVVSGAAALLLSQRPALTPDQVKDLLRRVGRRPCRTPPSTRRAPAPWT